MSHNLSQPEEIDYALMEMAGNIMEVTTPVQDNKHLSEDTQKAWGSGYVSPYRAIKMKSIHSVSGM